MIVFMLSLLNSSALVHAYQTNDAVLVDIDSLRATSEGDTSIPIEMKDSTDFAAEGFVLKCSGCHTVGHGKLNGPDLIGSKEWPDADLRTKIKLMESKVGQLSSDEVEMYRSFLKSDGIQGRISRQKERASQSALAQLAPPEAPLGKQLFMGTNKLQNGGLACVTCHRVGARGGTMGPDLTDAFDKLGRVALMSSIEAAQYNVMRGAYEQHPVTAQESAHLAEFLSQREMMQTESLESKVDATGVLFAIILFGLIVFVYRKKQAAPRGLSGRV